MSEVDRDHRQAWSMAQIAMTEGRFDEAPELATQPAPVVNSPASVTLSREAHLSLALAMERAGRLSLEDEVSALSVKLAAAQFELQRQARAKEREAVLAGAHEIREALKTVGIDMSRGQWRGDDATLTWTRIE